MTPFGRYELLALLAKGGLAEIWLARQTGMAGFEKLVVVKRLHERLQKEREYVDMFLDEARINSRLQHTNVLTVYELGEIDGRYFLTMEYLEGMPLGVLAQKSVARLGDLPIAIAGGLITQAAHGLHYAHEATSADGKPLRIVHRDVSPLNLLVSFDGVLKIADFSVAKAEGRLTRTKSGVIKGTPTYMSPEQCTGEAIDRRSDVFALGILLWELLSGRRLFKRDDVDETYRAITTGAVPPPSAYRIELSPSIDALVLRALARRPGDRFPTAEAMRQELEAVLHKEGMGAEVIDVRTFLSRHFSGEREEQEALLVRVRQGQLDASQGPIFAHAEHGLDDAAASALIAEPPYSDGDTERDTGLSGEDVPLDSFGTLPTTVQAPSLPAASPPQSEVITLRDKGPRSIVWTILLVVIAVAAAAFVGLVAGRHAGIH